MSALVLAIYVVLLTATARVAQEQPLVWTFEMDQIGTLPGGFVGKGGEWKILADTTAPSRAKVLAQRARNPGSTYNIVLCKDTTFKDIDLSVKMKAIAGEDDQGGGLVWRAKGVLSYYLARYNPLEGNYRVYKVDRGERTQMQSASVKLDSGWHTLRVVMKDDHIQCFLDGKLYLDVRDHTFIEAGQFGLWSKADAQSYFNDLTVSAPEQGTPPEFSRGKR